MAHEEQLKEQLAEAAEHIQELQTLLEQLTAEPLATATVFQELEDHIVVLNNGKMQLCSKPALQVEVGDVVALAQSGQILEKIENLKVFGEIGTVRSVKVDEEMLEVEIGGNIAVVFYNSKKWDITKGDRVLTDKGVLVSSLGKEENRFRLSGSTNITWSDVGGQDNAKRQLIEAIELPLQHPEIYEKYNQRGIKGVALFGPPGCGKTLLGKACATSIQEIFKQKGLETEADPFMYVKGPELLEKWVGMAEQNIRAIFARARQFKEENGYPAIVFLDEADAILGKRGSGISSDMEKTIVPMFLAEMDGMDENGALVILATNRVDTLDPAILREGRIDRKIGIERPDQAAASEIFEIHLKEKPLAPDVDVKAISEKAAEHLFGQQAALYNILMKGEKEEVVPFTLGQISSGAQIEGIVQQATSIALHRDLAGNGGDGLEEQDLMEALDLLTQSERARDLKTVVQEYVEPFKKDIKTIAKVK